MKMMTSITISFIILFSLSFVSFADTTEVIPVQDKILHDAEAQGLTKEIVEKLDPDQLVQVITSLKELDSENENVAGSMVDNLVPIFFFLTILLILSMPLYFHFRKNRLLHETLRAMVEKGTQIPPQLLMPTIKKNTDLRKGIIFITTGLAIAGFFLIYSGISEKNWSFGLIPLIIGVGYLLAWKFQSRSNGNQEE